MSGVKTRLIYFWLYGSLSNVTSSACCRFGAIWRMFVVHVPHRVCLRWYAWLWLDTQLPPSFNFLIKSANQQLVSSQKS